MSKEVNKWLQMLEEENEEINNEENVFNDDKTNKITSILDELNELEETEFVSTNKHITPEAQKKEKEIEEYYNNKEDYNIDIEDEEVVGSQDFRDNNDYKQVGKLLEEKGFEKYSWNKLRFRKKIRKPPTKKYFKSNDFRKRKKEDRELQLIFEEDNEIQIDIGTNPKKKPYHKGKKWNKNLIIKDDEIYIDYEHPNHKKYKEQSIRYKRNKELRQAMYGDFLSKNANYSIAEKQILSGLGMLPMNTKEKTIYIEDERNQENINIDIKLNTHRLSKGKIFKLGKINKDGTIEEGQKYYIGKNDKTILNFLAKFRFANSRLIKNMFPDKAVYNVEGILNRMKRLGYVKEIPIIGIPGSLWTPTRTGLYIIGKDLEFPIYTYKSLPKMITLPSMMGVNYIASCLYRNTINVLNLDDFPYKGRTVKGRKVNGENLISEWEIVSNWYKSIYMKRKEFAGKHTENFDGKYIELLKEEMEIEWRKWENNLTKVSPEVIDPMYWILIPKYTDEVMHYHIPDLVLSRERDNKKPKSIAVEVERAYKKASHIRKILMAYKQDNRLYEKVIWITPNGYIAKRIMRVANEIGFNRIDVVPFINEKGIMRVTDTLYI